MGKLPNIRGAMRQALEATDGRPVVAIVKDNGTGAKAAATWACMTMDDWLDLVAARSWSVMKLRNPINTDPKLGSVR